MSSTCSRAFGGWLAGCGAATAVLSGVAQTLLIIMSGGDITRLLGGIVALLLPSFLVFVVTCFLTAIPAAIVIWVGEELLIGSAVFFGCAGTVIGALSISVLLRSPAVWTSGLGCLFAVAGFVAGLTYWFVVRELEAGEYSS
ncbi:hypothetical protein [Bradyrhizobium uaiense]|uniref:Uncharacterized protein n=1 Tax=Bradyrhizobium uaiense TaxID=2594946 RepID=A0A6P1BRS3_9BRAD|nr:hypothetical protein [Bradyrhizobium uaiense]NEV01218.1 hypothetical protein [Bradyrhizobium uaiense]